VQASTQASARAAREARARLWRHIVSRAHEGRAAPAGVQVLAAPGAGRARGRGGRVQVLGAAKVGQDQVAVRVQQQVLRLEVAVHHLSTLPLSLTMQGES